MVATAMRCRVSPSLVEQLETIGLGYVARADLNGDGVLDMADIEQFLNGVEPEAQDDPNSSGDEPLNLSEQGDYINPPRRH